jgi:4-hydroxybutyrate dehydrogenase
MMPMKEFAIRPKIAQCNTCAEFAAQFAPTADDLILSNEYIYTPNFAALRPHLGSHTLFLEKYGAGEPSDDMVEAIVQDLPEQYDRVIAIGGGAVIDVAKVLALKTISPILDLYDGKAKIEKGHELILVPTTCGTGSEVTNISILALNARNTKKGLADPALFADTAVLLPELLQNLPFRFFATSSIDALVHAVESSLSPKGSELTRLFGYRAIDMILRGFMTIRDKGQDARIPLLGDFLLASNYAGIAFGNAGCAAVHAMAYPLGAVYHVPHGESNYAMFTGVLNKYMSIKSDGEIAKLNAYIADILGCALSKVYEELENLLNVLLPKKPLREYGMTQGDLQSFTHSVRENQQRLMANNFVPLGDEDVLDIYTKLW